MILQARKDAKQAFGKQKSIPETRDAIEKTISCTVTNFNLNCHEVALQNPSIFPIALSLS
jgi:hypothetical protein